MTETEIPVVNGTLRCTNGRTVTPTDCRFCMHSRYFIINGKKERSPALAFCLCERVTKPAAYEKARAVGCAERAGDGFANIGNIIA